LAIARRAQSQVPPGSDPEYFGPILQAVWHAGLLSSGVLGIPADQPKRLDPEFRATLTEFAQQRIEAVWNDVGETDAATLAQNIVAAQEFAWMSLHVPVPADQVSDSAKPSNTVTDNYPSQPPAVQRTADRDRLRTIIAVYLPFESPRDLTREQRADEVIDHLTSEGVLVPADQIRAETLEAAADAVKAGRVRVHGIPEHLQSVGGRWLRTRAAEARKAAGA